jgi:hypothetical protein
MVTVFYKRNAKNEVYVLKKSNFEVVLDKAMLHYQALKQMKCVVYVHVMHANFSWS